MAKKKKKDLDFQKVKLKVGRKLKRDSNETKAEFKSRKIVLKEVKSYSNDPLTALARHSDHISQHGKLSMLNHFNSALTGDIVRRLNKPILDSLSKFIVDHSDQVRTAAIKCLKNCFNHTKQQHLSTREFMQSLKPYMDCAYTHVSAGIVADAQKFLDYFVAINDPNIFEPLMEIILRRYEAGGLTQAEKKLAIKLKRYYTRHRQKETVSDMMREDHLEPLVWTETNCILDLDNCIHSLDHSHGDLDREVRMGVKEKRVDVVDRYLSLVVDEDFDDSQAQDLRASKRRRIY